MTHPASSGPYEAVIVAARRTFIGTAGRGHRDLLAHELAAPVLRATLDDARAAGAPEQPDDVVLGNCTGPGGNLARVSVLAAGLGAQVPAMTVDRQCGSGLAAVLTAAQGVRAGDSVLALAGGTESASTAPLRSHRPGHAPGRTNDGPLSYERAPFAPTSEDDPDMGRAADALAAASGITRERQDAYAAASHARAMAAHARGAFDDEVVRVGTLDRDERARRLDPVLLARLRPAFSGAGTSTPGTVTAGNASPLSDGAAAVALVRARPGLVGLRIVAGSVVGCDPRLPGWGAAPAARAVLDRTGTDVRELAAVEIVEAFAAQVLAVTDALSLDPLGRDADRVCPDGGALALGHPWGASGAVCLTRLYSRLVRGGAPAGTRAMAAASVGGGMGVAVLVEVVR